MHMQWNFDSELFESQTPTEKIADVEETEIETFKYVKLKTKEVIQVLETLKRIAEMNGASDNATISQHEF